MPTLNGCTCADVREMAIQAGNPMPGNWVCYGCRGRQRDSIVSGCCKQCGVGLYYRESKDKLCSICYFAANGL